MPSFQCSDSPPTEVEVERSCMRRIARPAPMGCFHPHGLPLVRGTPLFYGRGAGQSPRKLGPKFPHASWGRSFLLPTLVPQARIISPPAWGEGESRILPTCVGSFPPIEYLSPSMGRGTCSLEGHVEALHSTPLQGEELPFNNASTHPLPKERSELKFALPR